MLLVQIYAHPYPQNIILFQYIICCWFKLLLLCLVALFSSFQYIICCWFKILYLNRETHETVDFNTLYVVGSIAFHIRKKSFHVNFNTLYVVGSR